MSADCGAKSTLLDDLAAALVLLDTEDPRSLRDLLGLLDKVSAQGVGAAPAVAEARSAATALLGGSVSDPEVELRRLNGAVAALHESGQGSSGPPYVWADEELMREFVTNQRGSLQELEGELLALEKGSLEAPAAVRRRIHGLKGEAGVVGLDALADVYHAIEDLLATDDLMARVGTLLQVRDWLEKAVETFGAGGKPEPSAQETAHAVRAAAARAPESAPESAPVAPPAPAPAASAERGLVVAPGESVERDADTVALYADFLHEADDGLARVDQLLIDAEKEAPDLETANVLFRVFHSIKGVSGFLECRAITSLAHATENVLNQIRKGNLELKGGTLDLIFNATEAMRRMLTGVKAAVEGGIALPEAGPQLDGLLADLKEAGAGRPIPGEPVPHVAAGAKLGEILTQPPINVPAEVIQLALEKQQQTGRRLGEELVAQGVAPKEIAHGLRAQAGSAAVAKIQETIKVDVSRIDQLVEIVGELVVVESMVVNAPEIAALTGTRIRNYLNQLHKITRDAQDIGMRMRMVPVRGVFQKMARMVRDLSHKSGKTVQIELSGEGTEMDRSMVEQVADPLVHMIRNAVDHGIEAPEDRERAGKDRVGVIRLRAFHEGDHIVIEIADDGKGLDQDAILRKAVAQGLVREGESLSDAEIHQLIFLPGFSTAKQVTEISGRGVGMDVVKRNLEAMRGRIIIETTLGQGTTFKLLLPLTLAIIDGMLVRCGEERYLIPTLSILESVKPSREMLVTFAERGECINVRGEILPLMRLDRLFGIDGAIADPSQGLVVLLEAMGRTAGLLVDQVVSQQKVVIKSMGSDMQEVRFVSGAAILSDGTVGLILNAEQLVYSDDRGRQRVSAVA
ncbi:MAG: chemotaxis protein CheW [Deltaproteobacteria bacterium]|nr:chemotaxis protein CheW [Deltaproteobacteria bacterium]